MIHSKPHVIPAWAAFLFLPLVAFAERIAYNQSVSHLFDLFVNIGLSEAGAIMRRGPTIEMAGMGAAAVATLVIGPHLVTGLSLSTVVAAATLLVGAEMPIAHDLLVFGHGAASVGLIATVGSSAGGATPALRHGTMFATYAAIVLGTELAPHANVLTSWSGITAGALGLAALLVPTATWWFNNRPLRQPTEGVTWRALASAALLFCLLLSTIAAFSLLDPLLARAQSGWRALLDPSIQVAVAVLLACGLAVAQLLKIPGRVGMLAGIGAMLIALAATLTWSWGDAAPGMLFLGMSAIGEVCVLPWAWSRATSDAHWRTTGLLAFIVLLPYSLSGQVNMLTAISASMVLAVAAIPIGGLGWIADEWVFGDTLGLTDPRGRR